MTENSSDVKRRGYVGSIETLKACTWADFFETMQEIERFQDDNGVLWASQEHDSSVGRVLAVALAVTSK